MHDDITELKRDIGLDCGDHSCRYAVVRTGMRTNGGCRCEPPAKQIADLTRRLEEAERKNDEFFKEWKACRDVMRGKVNDPDPLVPCGDERDLTLFGMVSGVLRSRDALKAKLAAVEQERDTMRTALLALPGVVKELEQALDVLDNYYDGAEESSIKWLGAPMYYVRNAKERLAQAMRGK